MSFEEGAEFIESLPDTEAFWILGSGEFLYSSHFRDHLKK
jgi:hypothetical protein